MKTKLIAIIFCALIFFWGGRQLKRNTTDQNSQINISQVNKFTQTEKNIEKTIATIKPDYKEIMPTSTNYYNLRSNIEKLSESEIIYLLNNIDKINMKLRSFSAICLYEKWGRLSVHNAIAHLNNSTIFSPSLKNNIVESWCKNNPNEAYNTVLSLKDRSENTIFSDTNFGYQTIFNALAKENMPNDLEKLKKYRELKDFDDSKEHYFVQMASHSTSKEFAHLINTGVDDFFSKANEKELSTIKKKILESWIYNYPEDAITWVENISDNSVREAYLTNLLKTPGYISKIIKLSSDHNETLDLLYNTLAATTRHDNSRWIGNAITNLIEFKDHPRPQERLQKLSRKFLSFRKTNELVKCLNA